MRNFYTILFWEKGKWHNECVLYPDKKRAERRKRFILHYILQEYQDKEGNTRYKHFGQNEVQIFKVEEKVIFKKEENHEERLHSRRISAGNAGL